MIPIAIYILIAYKISKIFPHKAHLCTGIMIGSILYELEIIYTIINLIKNPFHDIIIINNEIFPHSVFIPIFTFLAFAFSSEILNNKNFKNLGQSFTIGLILHIFLDTISGFKNVDLFWPLPISKVNLLNISLLNNEIHKIFKILEFLFFSFYAWFLIKINIIKQTKNSWIIKYLNIWKKFEIYVFILLIIIFILKLIFILYSITIL